MIDCTSIVVGVDFTPCSAAALVHGLRIRDSTGAALQIVHVIDTLVAVELEEALSPMQQDIREGLIADAKEAWARFATGVPGAESVPIQIRIDNRIHGIVETVHEQRADLLVLGAFGSQSPDVGVGTVATGCIRKSPADVLLVRDTQVRPFRTLVVGVDFSPTSQRAVKRAASIAAKVQADLHVVHVFCGPWHRLHYRAPTVEVAPHFQKQYRDGLHGRLVAFTRSALNDIPPDRVHLVVHDDQGHRSGLVEYAAGVSADLMIVGTRGRTTLRDLLLGTFAEKVLRNTPCSVLAVKPPGAKDDTWERVA
jgi:nucleotide-binding universal stress UspA family protein